MLAHHCIPSLDSQCMIKTTVVVVLIVRVLAPRWREFTLASLSSLS